MKLDKRIIVRTTANLSFTGERCEVENNEGTGILIKPSPKSNIKIWVPLAEISSIIFPNGKQINGPDLSKEIC